MLLQAVADRFTYRMYEDRPSIFVAPSRSTGQTGPRRLTPTPAGKATWSTSGGQTSTDMPLVRRQKPPDPASEPRGIVFSSVRGGIRGSWG